jgi:hypothetical protein
MEAARLEHQTTTDDANGGRSQAAAKPFDVISVDGGLLGQAREVRSDRLIVARRRSPVVYEIPIAALDRTDETRRKIHLTVSEAEIRHFGWQRGPAPKSAASPQSRQPAHGQSRRLLMAEGKPLTVDELALRLGVPAEEVEQRRQGGKIIGIRTTDGYLYPSWQIASNATGTLPGLEEVLCALSAHDPWMQLAFMLNMNSWLDGSTPLIELRRENLQAVLEAASMYGEHVAV